MGDEQRCAPGDRIGDYRIERVDARSEWDDCEAVHLVLPRRVTLRVTAADAPQAGVRLLREACILEALGHPGVPRVYDCGRLGDRRVWTATEVVAGVPLADRIAQGPLPPTEVASLLRDVVAILDHAHQRGVVHGAIRIDAIRLVDPLRGSAVCVCDWSSARGSDVAAPLDDVLALGMVVLEALTGSSQRIDARLGQRLGVSPATAQLGSLVDAMLGTSAAARPPSRDVRIAALAITDALAREIAEGTDLAAAIDAIEEIDLDDVSAIDEVRIVDEPLPASMLPPPPPPAAIAAEASGGTAVARLRRMRWTPQLGTRPTQKDVAAVEVEVEVDVEQTTPRPR